MTRNGSELAREGESEDLPSPPNTFYVRHGKLCLDIALGGLALVVTAPLQVLIGIAVHRYLGTPVLFRQSRTGLDGKPFQMIKFRTMTDERDLNGQLLPDEDRLNEFGRLLRSTSLDELPELLNVVRGDLSLVGPRPLLPAYLNLYSARQARRHSVRPGVTGLAQVSGRNNIGWRERFDLDIRYVESVSLALDLKILVRTIGTVIARRDTHPGNNTTMPGFTADQAA